jgi:hypothetical protein
LMIESAAEISWTIISWTFHLSLWVSTAHSSVFVAVRVSTILISRKCNMILILLLTFESVWEQIAEKNIWT